METKDSDVRVIRTRKSIKAAFADLLLKKGFESITIKDITTAAAVNRGTFYKHYQDKYDLLAQCQQELATDLAKTVRRNAQDVERKYRQLNTDTPFTLALEFFCYIKQNRRIFLGLLRNDSHQFFQELIKDKLWQSLFINRPENPFKISNSMGINEYLADYIAGALLAVVAHWLENNCHESEEQMAELLTKISSQGIITVAGLRED